jgi:uncharacterized membrane protein YoaK (UPF0700 family)
MAATPPYSAGVTWEGALQACIAGFVDTCGFVALFGLFTAHVTGNLVLIGATLAEPHSGLIAKLLALPVFVLAVALGRGLILVLEGRGRKAAAPLLVAQALLLCGFLVAGLWAEPVTNGDAPRAILAGMFGVAAMALQNLASRTVFAGHAPTTVMTGNVTQLVIDLADRLFGRGTPASAARFRKMAPAVLAFTGGALAGALGFANLGFACLGLPIAAVAVLILQEIRRP